MKKIEATMIKRLMRINSTPLVSFSLEHSLFSLFSHTIAHLKHSWSTLALEKGRQRKVKKAKESKGQARKIWIKQLQQEYVQVIGCMCEFLAG